MCINPLFELDWTSDGLISHECDVVTYVAAISDAPVGRISLGASVQNGIEQKGIHDLAQCLKKCSLAGGGIQQTVYANNVFTTKIRPCDGVFSIACGRRVHYSRFSAGDSANP